MTLNTPIIQLTRVGTALAKRLKHLGIETARDLLFYFPFRYEDFSHIAQIRDLKEGEQVTVKGRIELIANKRSPRKRVMITEAVVADGTGQMRVIWFGQPFITKLLKVGDKVYFSGKVTNDMFGAQMVGPSYERAIPLTPALSRGERVARINSPISTTHTARIVPLYPLTSGITHKQMRFLMSQVIPLAKEIEEWLPEDIRTSPRVPLLRGEGSKTGRAGAGPGGVEFLMPLSEAIRAIHFPESTDEMKHAERRLKFDELFVLQLRAEMIRQSLKRAVAPVVKFQEAETKKFVASLPFALTKDQKVAAWEILQDMQKPEPMNRLLEGDVGSGKTVVAALVMYNAVLNGYQAVMMAPTEILAYQHFESLVGLFEKFKVRVGLLAGSRAQESQRSKVKGQKSLKDRLIETIANGEVNIIVGTHALLTEKVAFKQLGLVIVDEQHRFGVEQRKTIREKSMPDGRHAGMKGVVPHFLSMTATPIPRSFALTLYGDLDISVIKQMPPGRKPVKTRLVAPHNREKAYGFIREQVKQGRQVFVICPLISNEQRSTNNDQRTTNNNGTMGQWDNVIISDRAISDNSEKKSVMAEYEKLSKKIFPDLRVGYLHGKMKSKEKDEVMKKFVADETDILVSTSVVEVGVDIPNASVMMIEGAERFGLAQLHQFRGRVGRSTHQSFCFLFTDSDSAAAQERLEFFEKTTDGFALAEYDLHTRGPGEVYGTTQSGMMNLRLATMRDVELIKLARDVARGIDFAKYSSLKERVKEWETAAHLE